jgi:hypothetical protein
MKIKSAREATKWISIAHPKVIKFRVDQSAMEVVNSYLSLNTPEHYHTLMCIYGVLYMLGLVEYYKLKEQFEICANIIKAIELHNSRFDQDLPLDINSDTAMDYMDMTPSEMLNTHILIEELKTGKPYF